MTFHCPECNQAITAKADGDFAYCAACEKSFHVPSGSTSEPAKPTLQPTEAEAGIASLRTTLRSPKSIHGRQQQAKLKAITILLNLTILLVVGGLLVWANARPRRTPVGELQTNTEYGWPFVACKIERGKKLLYRFQESSDPYAPALVERSGNAVHISYGAFEGEWHHWEKRQDHPKNLLLNAVIALALTAAACWLPSACCRLANEGVDGVRQPSADIHQQRAGGEQT